MPLTSPRRVFVCKRGVIYVYTVKAPRAHKKVKHNASKTLPCFRGEKRARKFAIGGVAMLGRLKASARAAPPASKATRPKVHAHPKEPPMMVPSGTPNTAAAVKPKLTEARAFPLCSAGANEAAIARA